MPTTADYISAIRARRSSKSALALDFDKLPKEVDVAQIKQELSYGLPAEYGTAIHGRTKVKIDFSKVPFTEPAPAYVPGQLAATMQPSQPIQPDADTLARRAAITAGARGATSPAIEAIKEQLKKALFTGAYAGAGAIKGASMGYIDPSQRPEVQAIPASDRQKAISIAAGEIIGSGIPITGIGSGVSAAAKLSPALARMTPWLKGISEAGATGAVYGAAKKPEKEGVDERAKNAAEDAAVFMAFAAVPAVGSKIAETVKKANWYRKLTIPERAVAISEYPTLDLPDKQMMEIFKKSPEGVQKVLADKNPKMRKILQTGSSKVSPASAAEQLAKPSTTLPAAKQPDFMKAQSEVIKDVVARGDITKEEIPSLVLDKAKDGITLREIVERKMTEFPQDRAAAVKSAADEYHGFLQGIKKTAAAQAEAVPPEAQAPVPEPVPATIEPAPAPVAAPALAKQPWEMTRKEAIARGGFSQVKDLSSEQLAQVANNDGVPLADLKKNFNSWVVDLKTMKMRGEEAPVSLENYYEVKQALSEGKPVPPEVLKDYPDLAVKPAAAPAQLVKNFKYKDVVWERDGVDFEILPPGTQANRGNKWEAGVRYKGWAKQRALFNSKAEAIKYLDAVDTSKIKAPVPAAPSPEPVSTPPPAPAEPVAAPVPTPAPEMPLSYRQKEAREILAKHAELMAEKELTNIPSSLKKVFSKTILDDAIEKTIGREEMDKRRPEIIKSIIEMVPGRIKEFSFHSHDIPAGLYKLPIGKAAKIKAEADPIKAMSEVVDKEDSNRIIRYVFGDVKNGAYVATDGRILTVIPAKNVKEGYWTARHNKARMEIAGQKVKEEGAFPPWEKIVPADNTLKFYDLPADFLSRIATPEALQKTTSRDFNVELILGDTKIYFNPNILRRAINPLIAQGAKKLSIGISKNTAPAKIVSEGKAFSVAMPLRMETANVPYVNVMSVSAKTPATAPIKAVSKTKKTPTETISAITQEIAKPVAEKIGDVYPPIGMTIERVGGALPPKGEPPHKPFKFSDPKVEQRWAQSHGVKPKTWGDYLRETKETLARQATREFEWLPRGPEHVELRKNLLELQKYKGVAAHRGTTIAHAIAHELTPAEFETFEKAVLMRDLAQEAAKDRPLPFGFNKNQVAKDLAELDAVLDKNPKIQSALYRRAKAYEDINNAYIGAMDDIGFDVTERFGQKDYFHHQVLEYANAKASGLYGTGGKLRTPTGRGFLKKREGSELDINTDYFQSEIEVLSQQIHDIKVAQTIKFVDDHYNKAGKLPKDANGDDIIPEGYTEWQPREGNTFYMASSIPEKLAAQIAEGMLKSIAPGQIKKVLAMGGMRKTFIIPEEVAKTLDEIGGKRLPPGIAEESLKAWKVYQLVSPVRFAKYNIRNTTGDLEAAITFYPKSLREVPDAINELYASIYRDKPMSKDMSDWFERGGMQSNLQFGELGDIKDMEILKRFYEKDKTGFLQEPAKAWNSWWGFARKATDFREAILRYSVYKAALKDMRANNGIPTNFGASDPAEIMALGAIEDRAYWISNDTLGAYDKISALGQDIRKKWIPFWSWKEANMKRYVQGFKNAIADGKAASTLGRAAGAKSPFMAWRVGKFIAGATATWGALQAYNVLAFPEEEKALPPDIRNKPHIILGKDSEGNVKYFHKLGALGDILGWVAMDAPVQTFSDWLNGRITIKDIAKEMAKAPINVVIGGMAPLQKTIFELAAGRSFFPDVFSPRTIRDRGLYLAQQFGLADEYKSMSGMPTKGWIKRVENLLWYKINPGESAYFQVQDMKRRFAKSTGREYDGFILTPRANALYNMKLAVRLGDKEAFEKYMAEYILKGGSPKEAQSAVLRMHPLAGMSVKNQRMFMGSLTNREKEVFNKAVKFYNDHLLGQYKAMR